MKRAVLVLLLAATAAVAAWSQPKIAVLDAMIPQNMDPSVIVPATEKIIERLVVSGRFTVLDRANIESVLKEREFQVSGMVSDQDVVTAGKYLGADFVVVAKVSKVADTYFISAKMIAIKTGVIANQTSAEGEGKLSTLIDLASQVGEVLSGGAVLAQSAAGGSSDISKPSKKPDASTAKSSGDTTSQDVTPPPKKPADKLKTTILSSVGGSSAVISDSGGTIDGAGAGGDIFVLIPLVGGLSVVANVDFQSYISSSNSLVTWSQDDFLAGVGYALKLGFLVPYVDIKGGLTSSTFNYSTSTSGSGGAFGLDLGVNFDIGRWFVLGVRYQYVGSSLTYAAFTDTESLTSSSFFFSAGVRF